jgi:catechol 2,3-dioxygenase-like lactoylglutathione lyase family enzyme
LIEGLGSVLLEVRDLERSLAFYCDGLRFDLDRQEDGETPSAVLRAGELRVVLLERKAGRHSRGPVQLSIEVSAVDAYYDALVARGLRPGPLRDGDSSRSFVVHDPDGVAWRFEQSLS